MRKTADDSNREAVEIGKLGGCGVPLLRVGLIEARIKATGERNPVPFLATYPQYLLSPGWSAPIRPVKPTLVGLNAAQISR